MRMNDGRPCALFDTLREDHLGSLQVSGRALADMHVIGG